MRACSLQLLEEARTRAGLVAPLGAAHHAAQDAGHADFSPRWHTPGDEKYTNVPSMIYPNNSYRDLFYLFSEANVIKGDNIRLQFINLIYTVAASHKSKPAFTNFQVYLNAANLGILWRSNHDDIDPQYQDLAIPAKTYTIGIKCNF